MILVAYLATCHGLPQGAPPKACLNMLPIHPGASRQKDTSPFSVTTEFDSEGILVTVASGLGIPFEGFMLQARGPDGTLLGTFEANSEKEHTIDCNNVGDSLTHSNTAKRELVQTYWQPKGYEGPVIFK